MPAWPPSLPARPLAGSFDHSPFDPATRSPADLGPPMSRARANIDYATYGGSFNLATVKMKSLERFWRDDCNFGTTTFDHIDWLTGVPCSYKFATRPTYRHLAGDVWQAAVMLTKIPGT